MAINDLPQAPVDELSVECALTSVGLSNLLKGEARYRNLQKDYARSIPDQVAASIRRFLSHDQVKVGKQPAFNLKQVEAAVDPDHVADHAQAIVDAFKKDPLLGQAVAQVVARIINITRSKLPQTDQPSVFGARPQPPSQEQVSDLRRFWEIATRPLSILDDLQEHSLSPDQVSALQDLYPALYALVTSTVPDVVAGIQAARPKWRGTSRQEALIKMLVGYVDDQPPLDMSVLMQQGGGQGQAKGSQPPRRSTAKVETDYGTPGQKTT